MSALSPVAQEIVTASRKYAKYFAGEGSIFAGSDVHAFWDRLLEDRNQVAIILTCLFAKLIGTDPKMEIGDLVANLLGERAMATEPIGRGSVKTDLRRSVDYRAAALNTVYYIILNFPVDATHYGVRAAYLRWNIELDQTGGRDGGIEEEISKMLMNNDYFRTDDSIRDFLQRCSQFTLIQEELINTYNNPTNTFLNNKLYAESLIFFFLVNSIGRNRNSIGVLFQEILQLFSTATSETQIFSLLIMIREFIFIDNVITPGEENLLMELLNFVKRYYVYPAPICYVAKDVYELISLRQSSPEVFLSHRSLELQPYLLTNTRLEEPVHLIFNRNSLLSGVITEYLTSLPISTKEQKLDFIYFCVTNILPETQQMTNIQKGTDAYTNEFFAQVVDVLRKSASMDSSHSKTFCHVGLTKIVNAMNEYASGNGIQDTVDLTSFTYSAPDGLQFYTHEIPDSNVNYLDKIVKGPAGSEFPLLPSYAILEEIFNQVLSLTNTAANNNKQIHPRIIIAGGDTTLTHVVCAYAVLRSIKPAMFSQIIPQFYVLPTGKSNSFANYMAVYDPWYGSHVYSLIKSLSLLVPGVSPINSLPSSKKNVKELFDENNGSSTSLADLKNSANVGEGIVPAKLFSSSLNYYLHRAIYPMHARVYMAELYINAPNSPVTYRLIPFVQSVEFGLPAYTALLKRMSSDSKDSSAATKVSRRISTVGIKSGKFIPPEVSIKYSEINVGGVSSPAVTIPSKAYHEITVANLPRSTDTLHIVKPHSNALELHVLDLDAGRKSSRATKKEFGIEEGLIHYVSTVELDDTSSSKRLFEVAVDMEVFTHVSRVKITTVKNLSITSSEGEEPDLTLPFMTFMPEMD